MDFETEWRTQQRQEEAAFRSLFVEKSDDELLCSFFKWIITRGWWHQFWAAFRADGIMSWLEFENFVHWDGHWTGDKLRVFKELAKHCGADPAAPFLTASGVLDLKRWWEDMDDPGKRISLATFKSVFAEHYGNLGCAWRVALDTEDTGKVSFLTFCRICRSLGLGKNLKTTWEELTGGHPGRTILYHDWDPLGDRIVSRFAMSLSIKHGGMREGWDSVIKNAGGNMHFSAFADVCADLGFNIADAKWLFSVLDKEKRRYLNQFDRLRFLSHWDPGDAIPDITLQELKYKSAQSAKRGKKVPTTNADSGDVPYKLSHSNPFEFVLELNEEEYAEYQERLQARQLSIGQDEDARNAFVRRTARKEKEERDMAKVRAVLSRPVTARKFNNDGELDDPVLARFVQR